MEDWEMWMFTEVVSLWEEVFRGLVLSVAKFSFVPIVKVTRSPLVLEVYKKLRAWVEISFARDMN